MTDAVQLMTADLLKSGLTPADIYGRVIDSMERAATNVPFSINGYTIPYFDINGRSLPFYRVRLFDYVPKYKQLKDSPNHVYFPPALPELLKKSRDYIILTEGEKKAALCTKLGFPCVAISGVDSWRNRLLILPGDAELNQKEKTIVAKIGAQDEPIEDLYSPLALGMQELIDHLIATGRNIILIYDTDTLYGLKIPVQRAMAALAFDLRFRGIAFNRIRHLVLPPHPNADIGEKMSLDTFLADPKSGTGNDNDNVTLFRQMLDKVISARAAFPRHPSIRDFLNKRLQRPKLSRRELQQLSITLISELDAGGLRLRSQSEGQSYYFDFDTRRLTKARFDGRPEELSNTPFGQDIYQKYGFSLAADSRIGPWLSTHFSGEAPVSDVTPYRIIARAPNQPMDSVTLQISDSQFVVVNGEDKNQGLTFHDNGEQGILFESGHVQPLDPKKLAHHYQLMYQEHINKPTMDCWWADVLSHARLKDRDKARYIAALLFYMSPWLYRWRGIQLPIELTLGEAGSGKSTLYELRLNILTGSAILRNAPSDLKDWTASVANAGGLHVTDNVQLADKSLRQRLSDELCRLITSPTPSIEMRKYYTEADLVRVPVNCVFAITAIAQPFINADIMQRSIIIELDKSHDLAQGSLSYDSSWMAQQLKRFGGREAWVAHHLLVLHKFFRAVRTDWDHRYQAKNRLINVEQSFKLMAKLFGVDAEWIPAYLSGATERAVKDSDWALEGLCAFADYMRTQPNYTTMGFYAQDIVDWATASEEYARCEMLINTRRLGRYIGTHKGTIATACGIVEDIRSGNRQRFKVTQLK